MKKAKVGILSLGCPRNVVDSESILGRLNLKGYPIVDMHKADIGIVNTCAFIEDAKKESIDAILDLITLKKEGKLKKVIVYGCLAQRYKTELAGEFPEADAFVGRVSLNHSRAAFSITPRHFSYLKICEGCLNSCSFCAIPQIKGRFTSLDVDSILKKAEAWDKIKVSELNIIGQDTSGYGSDLYGGFKLAELLHKISRKIKNIGWLRLLYLYPDKKRVTDELLDCIAEEPRICKYVDLPIQHINDRILKLMHRHTTQKDILLLLDKIRKRIPGVAIRTSLIVGFPSETEKEFQELAKFVKDARFERLGAFIYSHEEATPAYKMKGQVLRKVKEERLNEIMLRQQKISQEVNQKFLGQTQEVLIDTKEKDVYLGRTQYDAPEVDGLVYVHSRNKLRPGDFVKVKITDTLEYDLVGEEIL
jgi:ribosomal protein S12 methylthiotransferase